MVGQEVNPDFVFEGEILLYLYSDGSVEKTVQQLIEMYILHSNNVFFTTKLFKSFQEQLNEFLQGLCIKT